MLLWGGVVVMVLYIPLRLFPLQYIAFCFLFAGLAAALLGVYLMGRLYRCPGCGEKLSGWKYGFAYIEEMPKHCPYCGLEIDVAVE